MKKLLFFFGFLQYFTIAIAQTNTEKTLEFEWKGGFDHSQIFPFAEQGLIFVNSENESGLPLQKKNEWFFEFYDSNLNLKKTEKMEYSEKFWRSYLYQTKTSFHAITMLNYRDIDICSFEYPNLTPVRHKINIEVSSAILNFKIKGDYALITTFDTKWRCIQRIINWRTGEIKTLDIDYQNMKSKNIMNSSIEVITASNDFFVITPTKFTNQIFISKISYPYEKTETILISDSIEKSNFTREYFFISSLNKETYAFHGKFYNSKHNGLININIVNNHAGKINYVSLLESVDEFSSAFDEKEKQKLDSKKEKQEYHIDYDMKFIDELKFEDGYVIALGGLETKSYSSFSGGITGINSNTDVYIPSKYLNQIILIKYGLNGDLLWTKSLKANIMDYTFHDFSYYERFFFSMAKIDKEEIEVNYSYNGSLITQKISLKGEIFEETKSDPIIFEEHIKNINDYNLLNVTHWYADNFITYGAYKNTSDNNKMFYISKTKNPRK